MLLKLAVKNITSRKSSLVIILFIAFSIMLLCINNALFDSTENGVKQTFVNSFTGDVLIRPVSRSPLSLFGDETPVTGSLTKVSSLIPFDEICGYVKNSDYVQGFFSQVSGGAAMEKDGNRILTMLFGVDGEKYAELMPAIKIIEGKPFKSGEKGVMLTSEKARQIGASIGDMVQFSIADGISFRIRACPLTAIYEYEIKNQTLDKIVLVDDQTLRSLMDLSDSSSSSIVLSDDMEDLFGDELDDDFFTMDDTEAVFTDEGTSIFTEIASEDDSALNSSGSWNFLVVKVKDGVSAEKAISAFNRYFCSKDWNIEAVNWRYAAGSTALYLYWMRIILNAGILIVLAAGFIVVNNTLEINVLERIKEIGTMRAIGATKSFVSIECMAETLILTLFSGIVGCILGFIGAKLISAYGITFTNSFLIQLFGNSKLAINVTMKNVLESLLFSGILGLLVWIYPVITALKTSPVQAMAGAVK